MRAPAEKLPAYVGTEVENAGYLIAQIVAVKAGDAGSAEQRSAQARVLQQQAAAADELAYAEGLKARHNVRILKQEYRRPAARADDTAAAGAAAKK
jgi:peptidyl-prolyl cis-trans isomerase D